jgi:SAM-dependent methyltransferase
MEASGELDEIPGAAESALEAWLETAPGQYLKSWQQAQFDELLGDIFGFHALQLALPLWPALQASRITGKWRYSENQYTKHGAKACEGEPLSADHGMAAPSVVGSFAALPFAERSVDLVLCLHALELSPDPHATLREIARILMPEGRLVITGFNPASLWGLRQRRARLFRRLLGERLSVRLGVGRLFLPDMGEFIAYWRLRDWLRLLDFDIVDTRFGCFRFAVLHEHRFAKWAWMERWGERVAAIFGGSYTIVAVKRVVGSRKIQAKWQHSKGFSSVRVRAAQQTVPQKGVTSSFSSIQKAAFDHSDTVTSSPCRNLGKHSHTFEHNE